MGRRSLIRYVTVLVSVCALVAGVQVMIVEGPQAQPAAWPPSVLILAFATAGWFAFTAAVCLTCLVRHAVYAGILALGLMLTLLSLVSGVAMLVWPHTHPTADDLCALFSLAAGALAAGTLLLAWHAVVRDWQLSVEVRRPTRGSAAG